MSERNGQHSITRGMLAGALGGLIASWAMNQFIAALGAVQQAAEATPNPQGEVQDHTESQAGSRNDEEPEDSTMKVADGVAWLVTGQHLSREAKEIGGPIVHYAFGALTGALYGAMAEVCPPVTAGVGTAFGTAVFVGADEVMVSGLISRQFPTEVPAASHLKYWSAHLVYGAATELVRRALA